MTTSGVLYWQGRFSRLNRWLKQPMVLTAKPWMGFMHAVQGAHIYCIYIYSSFFFVLNVRDKIKSKYPAIVFLAYAFVH